MTERERSVAILEQKFELLERIAAKHETEGDPKHANGIRQSVRLLRHQLIGDGKGCVITWLDPRRDDPEWAAFFSVQSVGWDSTRLNPENPA